MFKEKAKKKIDLFSLVCRIRLLVSLSLYLSLFFSLSLSLLEKLRSRSSHVSLDSLPPKFSSLSLAFLLKSLSPSPPKRIL